MQRSPLLKPLIGLSVLMLLMVVARAVVSALGLKAPWYLLHELTVMLVPQFGYSALFALFAALAVMSAVLLAGSLRRS